MNDIYTFHPTSSFHYTLINVTSFHCTSLHFIRHF